MAEELFSLLRVIGKFSKDGYNLGRKSIIGHLTN
jgi:hypothetical protein